MNIEFLSHDNHSYHCHMLGTAFTYFTLYAFKQGINLGMWWMYNVKIHWVRGLKTWPLGQALSLWLCHAASEILVLWLGVKPASPPRPDSEAQNRNHWTAREVSRRDFKKKKRKMVYVYHFWCFSLCRSRFLSSIIFLLPEGLSLTLIIVQICW